MRGQLSIIIVSYNVREFLHFCLLSISKATAEIDCEVIVVDNASHDGTFEFIESHHPGVKVIPLSENLGFSKACNIGAGTSHFNRLLFLNPDTLVTGEAINKCLEIFKEQDEVGLVSGRMIDGSGTYLPESARKKPTPTSSMLKLTGLANTDYYQYVDGANPMQIEVVSGAFVMVDKSVFESIGRFDESYFMYGEDIDLSVQASKQGFTNWHVPTAQIIHFKGESTNRFGRVYNHHFYNAMLIYYKKNISGGDADSRSQLSDAIVRLVGTIAKLFRLMVQVLPMILDYLIMVLLFIIVAKLWAIGYHRDADYFPAERTRVLQFLLPVILILVIAVNGFYFAKRKSHWIKGFVIGALLVLAVYSAFPESYRMSRPVVAIWLSMTCVYVGVRFWFSNYKGSFGSGSVLYVTNQKVTDVVGRFFKANFMGDLTIKSNVFSVEELYQEVVFDITSLDVMTCINRMKAPSSKVEYSFFDPENLLIVGSSDSRYQGRVVNESSFYNLSYPEYKIQKRMVDILAASFITLISPIVLILFRKIQFFKSLCQLWGGKKSMVTYLVNENNGRIPLLKSGFLNVNNPSNTARGVYEAKSYAMHYSMINDVALIATKFWSIIKIMNDGNEQ